MPGTVFDGGSAQEPPEAELKIRGLAGLAINMARQPARFHEFPIHSSRFDGRGVCFRVNTVDPFKSEDEFSLYFNFFPKHLCRSDP